MATIQRLSFVETPAGVVVRSLLKPKRGEGDAATIMRTGRWPSGESVSASDAYAIGCFLKPAPWATKNRKEHV